MDLAQMLVRSCVRSFYDTKHVLVIDALVIHNACRDDDLAYLMGMNTKELHKLCGRLKEDRFLAVFTRPEIKEGSTRPINRTYYWIDYRATIDAIKWRVYLIDKNVQGNTIPEKERKEYFCTRCKSEWTVYEILHKMLPDGFHCDKCDFLLVHDPDNNRGGHEQSTKLNIQFKFITDMLPKIDQVPIPENTFDQALANSRKVVRDETNPANETAPVDTTVLAPTAVRGMENVGPTSISVTLTTSSGPTAADIAAEKAQKEKIAAQNALPQHFTHSTITGEQVKFTANQPTFTSQGPEPDTKDAVGTPAENNADIDDYFARLKAEEAKEAEKEQDEEFETDDEEEDFEDVIPPSSGAATPASSLGGGNSSGALNSVLKKSNSESGPSTGVNSPLTTGTPDIDGRPSKKVRIEEPAVKQEIDEESEEDVEFEDAL